MNVIHRWGACVGIVLGAVSALAKEPSALERVVPVPATEPIPIIDFFRPRLLDDPEMNRSGTHLAALVTAGRDSKRFIVVELATGKIESVSGSAQREFYNFTWLDDRRLVLWVANEKLYADGLFSAEVGDLKRAFPIDVGNAGSLIGVPRARPTKPLYWIRHNMYDDGKDAGLVELDAKHSLTSSRDLIPGMQGTGGQDVELKKYGTLASISRKFPSLPEGEPTGYLADRDGELAFAFSQVQGVPRLFRFAEGRWIVSPLDLDAIEVMGVGDKPGELLVLAPGEAGKPRGLFRCDAATGALGEKLLQDARYECETASFYRHPADGRLLGMYYTDVARKAVWFDPKYAGVQKRIEASLPGVKVAILGSDPEENRFVVSVYSDVQPAEYVQVNLAAGTAGRIKQTRPWIDPKRMQPMRPIRFKTRDGLQLDAYLTLPAGTSKEQPAPLVVLPHGGPWVRDSWSWNGEVQFLASRGYAVLQPNYRGSEGYDALYPASDQYDFRKMHDDVTDAVAAIVKTGFVDADRIAIMGGSFGGFLAACGVAFEPERYRCAVSIAGVFDWERHIRDARRWDSNDSRYQFYRRHLGDPAKEREKFEAISPLRHASSIKVPVFVAHGRSDQVVFVEQSKNFVSELKKAGVPHVAHYESGEGHGMAYVQNEVELYAAIEKFLAENLKPRPAPAGAAAH